jgi:hypothetical protein
MSLKEKNRMRLKSTNLALILALIVTLSGSVFASKKASTQHSGAQHMVVGKITSIDANQVVVSEKVKGKEQSMTYKLDSSTQRSGNLTVGTPVTIQYRSENNQNVATTLRERSTSNAAKKSLTKTKKQ